MRISFLTHGEDEDTTSRWNKKNGVDSNLHADWITSDAAMEPSHMTGNICLSFELGHRNLKETMTDQPRGLCVLVLKEFRLAKLLKGKNKMFSMITIHSNLNHVTSFYHQS